jgi:hypothetical protein
MDEDAATARLHELAERHRAGDITDAEYAAAKRALLSNDAAVTDFGQETLVLPAVESSESPEPATRPHRGLVLLVVAAGLVVLVLAAVVWLGASVR